MMYFNELYNEVEPSREEKEKIARQNAHDERYAKELAKEKAIAAEKPSLLGHPTASDGSIVITHLNEKTFFHSRKEREKAHASSVELNAYSLSDNMFFVNEERFVLSRGYILHYKKSGGNQRVCEPEELEYPFYRLSAEDLEKIKAVAFTN